MKRLILLLTISLLLIPGLKAQTIQLALPIVDKRVELITIAARLAGYEEYSGGYNIKYVQDIHQYFDKYSSHPLIKFMQELRETNGISYDAVVSLAIHLEQPPSLKPLVSFNNEIPDTRWGAEKALKTAQLLQQFYNDSNFEKFYLDHQQYNQNVIAQLMPIYKQLDQSWFEKYYGIAPKSIFNIIIGLGNGSANYGPKVIFPDGREDIYDIVGVWKLNSAGTPLFDDRSVLPTMVHEFNHSFINYLTYKNKVKLEASGKTIYQAVSGKMKRIAYAEWPTMMSEALVRASVIRYLMDHNKDQAVAQKQVQEELSVGFVWIRQLVDLLGTYEENRKTYPTLDSFMPQIITFYNSNVNNINALTEDYQRHLAHVIAITPLTGSNAVIDPKITEIKIMFDKPLTGQGYSINTGKSGKEHYPISKFLSYTDNNTAIILQLALKPDYDYEFVLTGRSFKTPEGYPLEEYKVAFKTGH